MTARGTGVARDENLRGHVRTRRPLIVRAAGLALLSVMLSATAWSAEPEPLPDNAAISAGFAVPSKRGFGFGASAAPASAGFDLSDYERQIAAMPARPKTFSKDKTPAKIPPDFAPWWIRGQRTRIGESGSARILSVEELYQRALQHSKQIRVFSDLPLIRETGIQEAKGAFDTNTFLQGKFGHTNDPVGNTLTTGGASRFKQDEWTFEAGAKKKFIAGTEVTLSQKLGNLDNNSIYFVPNPQSTANLALSVVQPLLRGAGVSYNRSVMQVAKHRFAGRDEGIHPAKRIAPARNHAHLLGALRRARDLFAEGEARRGNRARRR